MFRVLIGCVILILSFGVYSEVIHKERSLYRNILVEESGDLLCLKFNEKYAKLHV